MSKVKPLRRRTLNLDQMHYKTLKLIRETRKQLRRMPHEPGMNDEEFIREILNPLQEQIEADREILKMQGWPEGQANEIKPMASEESCPFASPHHYCAICKADPCPLGLGSKHQPN